MVPMGRKKAQTELMGQLTKGGKADELIAALDRLTDALKVETQILIEHRDSLNTTTGKLIEALSQSELVQNELKGKGN